MTHRLPHPSLAPLVLAGLLAGATLAHAAPQVWSGRTFTFTRLAFADVANPANQDCISASVCLTRANTKGLYNSLQEAGSGGPLGASPLGTEWATGDAVNYASLSFRPWIVWANADPPSTIGVDAVVHVIAEDIYIDIRFDSWAYAISGGGAYSYQRGVPVSVPTARPTWGSLKSLYR